MQLYDKWVLAAMANAVAAFLLQRYYVSQIAMPGLPMEMQPPGVAQRIQDSGLLLVLVWAVSFGMIVFSVSKKTRQLQAKG